MGIYINNKPAQSQVSPDSPDIYIEQVKERIDKLERDEIALKDKLTTYPSLMRVIGTNAQREAIENPREHMAFFIKD